VPTPEQLSEVDALIRESSAVIAITCPREPWTKGLVDEDAQAALVNRILESGVPTVVVAAREPYGLRRFPNARTAVATYGYPDVSVRAAVDLIFGRIPATGKLPVTIPG
jgi:beta-N-acetylhexosaminidase